MTTQATLVPAGDYRTWFDDLALIELMLIEMVTAQSDLPIDMMTARTDWMISHTRSRLPSRDREWLDHRHDYLRFCHSVVGRHFVGHLFSRLEVALTQS
jgi:hypothetical protein